MSCHEDNLVKEQSPAEATVVPYHSVYLSTNSGTKRMAIAFEDDKLLHPESILVFRGKDGQYRIAVNNFKIGVHNQDDLYQPTKLVRFPWEVVFPEDMRLGHASSDSIQNITYQALCFSQAYTEHQYLKSAPGQSETFKRDFLSNFEQELRYRFKRDDISVNGALSAESEEHATNARYMKFDDLKVLKHYF